jgi:peptidoglycan/LPS O-acetylase OafA/YrhL
MVQRKISVVSSNRIPTLDGWRGIAIVLVLFDHIRFAMLQPYLKSWPGTGIHGVTIFFVLSGFLITSKLVERPIDLKRFYVRRFFRLMPTAWTYLAFILLFNHLVHRRFTSISEVQACVLFYRNFTGNAGGGLAVHFWSLSVEEQFYIVWPALLLLLGMRRCRWIAIAGMIGCASYRWLFWAHYDQDLIRNQTQLHADALLVGCLMALLLAEPNLRSAAERWSRLWALPVLAILIFRVTCSAGLAPLYECIAIACLLTTSTLNPNWIFIRPLSFLPLAWLGTVSYSVYVWQEFFVYLPWDAHLRLILISIGLPVITLFSYYCIERPSMRFGHQLTRKPTSLYETDTNEHSTNRLDTEGRSREASHSEFVQ